MNRAPHPNAAKVFINWLLSRRGQIALQKRTLTGESPADSLRTDIPKEDVPYLNRRLEGIKYLDTGKPEWIEMKPIIDVVNEALKVRGKISGSVDECAFCSFSHVSGEGERNRESEKQMWTTHR